MAKGQEFFGHRAQAAQLAVRLHRHFALDSPADASLVIGVFGEWGSGKSNLLQLVHESFGLEDGADGDEKGGRPHPVIVVAFNPWRYEKEEHLLVPLLKTVELEIERHIRDNETFWKKLGLLEHLKEGGRFAGVSALAFMGAFKGKFTLVKDVVDLEFDPEKFIKGVSEGAKQKEIQKPALDRLESYYFEFERRLQEYTTGDKAFRLLFLVDDLDRCLPEKAVEMLESIKLFLDVEGCAFVLALDDEVVERGIIHRYRDYIFQGNGQSVNEKSLAQLPITGPEYLEKIIHLPFRLPQPSRTEIRRFLQVRFPELFETTSLEPLLESDGEGGKHIGRMATERGDSRQGGDLLKLFVNHIPPVPRKQIRTAELILLLLDMAKARNCGGRIKPLPLAKLTLLQLFAPDLYRFGRRRYRGFMRTLQEWSGHPCWGQRSFIQQLKEENKPDKQNGDNSANESQQVEARNFDRFYAPLIEALEVCADNRSGFEPFHFIKENQLTDEELRELHLYFSFVDEGLLSSEERQTQNDETESQPVAELVNQEEFLDLLFSQSEGSWQSALQVPELEGRVLDDRTFELVAERLDHSDFQHLAQNDSWLRALVPYLGLSHFSRLAELADNFTRPCIENPPGQPTEEETQALFSAAQLRAVMRPEQQALLETSTTAIRSWLTCVLEANWLEVEQRAKAGRILSDLGDLRPGVTVKHDNGQPLYRQHGPKRHSIPDIDWQEIEEGEFTMGSKGDEGYDDEKPAHEVSVPRFFISRYPVTNAQYRCFIDAGIYQDEVFWNKLPEAAGLWLAGGAADEKLLASIKDKDRRKQYRDWLKKDTERFQPRFWDDRKWGLDNHPVVGVSWFEALAYSVWLNGMRTDLVPADGVDDLKIRLPREEEWEYAARGPQGLRYAWGGEPDAGKGNYDETKLGRTSAVGMFPAGEAFGLQDMSGNVWEWTSGRWGEDLSEPKFTYKQWEEQKAQRNLPEPVEFRMIRGGSWYFTADFLRCAIRSGGHPDIRGNVLGFRVVLG
ncbi:MAG: SUMF1/EgtB/PvdO family nonheme iron enzyme [Sedimenticola sp.]